MVYRCLNLWPLRLAFHCSQEHDRILLYTGLTLLTLFRFSHIFHTTLHWNQWQRDAARKAFRYLQMLGVFCMMLAKVLMKLHTKNAEHLPGWRRLTLILATVDIYPATEQIRWSNSLYNNMWHCILAYYIIGIYICNILFVFYVYRCYYYVPSHLLFSNILHILSYHISYTIRLPLL